jgi:hypothetical protein
MHLTISAAILHSASVWSHAKIVTGCDRSFALGAH